METPLSWEQQEVFRLLKAQPGTAYQESDETGRHMFRDWMRGVLEVSEVTVISATSSKLRTQSLKMCRPVLSAS